MHMLSIFDAIMHTLCTAPDTNNPIPFIVESGHSPDSSPDTLAPEEMERTHDSDTPHPLGGRGASKYIVPESVILKNLAI
jgi:hypothetical protein